MLRNFINNPSMERVPSIRASAGWSPSTNWVPGDQIDRIINSGEVFYLHDVQPIPPPTPPRPLRYKPSLLTHRPT